MAKLVDELDVVAAETAFSGVVRVERDESVELVKAYGLADRAHGIANTTDTQFGIASGVKGFTALAVVSLIEDGVLELSTTARSVLGDDLPLIGPDVTVEHLLTHRSGIGDHVDEDAGGDIADYVLPVPVHELLDTEQYLPVLEGLPPKFAAGERFSYCNAGYIVLALIAERHSGVSFHELVRQRVCQPASMHDTDFLRSDELPGRAALGYLGVDGPRTNVLHLPVRGSGDGGIYTTAADVHTFWSAVHGWAHRAADLGHGDDQTAQRRTGGVDAVRRRLLAARDRVGGDADRGRRGRVVPHRARPGREHDLHRAVQHLQRRLARGPPHRRSPGLAGPRVGTEPAHVHRAGVSWVVSAKQSPTPSRVGSDRAG